MIRWLSRLFGRTEHCKTCDGKGWWEHIGIFHRHPKYGWGREVRGGNCMTCKGTGKVRTVSMSDLSFILYCAGSICFLAGSIIAWRFT